MEFRILGKTGLKVSEIGLGAAQIGSEKIPDSRAEAVLNGALDLGIGFIVPISVKAATDSGSK